MFQSSYLLRSLIFKQCITNICVQVFKLLSSIAKEQIISCSFLSFTNLYIRFITSMSKNIINHFWTSYFNEMFSSYKCLLKNNVFFNWKSWYASIRNMITQLLSKSKMLHELQHIWYFYWTRRINCAKQARIIWTCLQK